jgi:hypothetical protein
LGFFGFEVKTFERHQNQGEADGQGRENVMEPNGQGELDAGKQSRGHEHSLPINESGHGILSGV